MRNSLRQHQLLATEAMDKILQIFEINDIPYYLLAGSCLGAVRHKGFIPWDDDIDIGVMNEDYDRLDEILSHSEMTPFVWMNERKNERYPRFYGKIIYNGRTLIDIFRIIRMPDSRIKQKYIWFSRKILYKLLLRKCNSYPKYESRKMYLVTSFFSRFISIHTIRSIIHRNEKICARSSGQDYINLYSVYSMEKEKIKKEWLEKPSKVLFENRLVKTVSFPDEYLTHLYGNYMELPSHEQISLRQHSCDLF